MNSDKKEVLNLVNAYIQAVHTQNETDFRSLWLDEDVTLISVVNLFKGLDSVYKDFLIGGIQAKYASIDLIAEGQPSVRFLDETTAVVIFAYRTECILREDGSEYGIRGLETQLLRKSGNGWKIAHLHYSKV